MFLSTGILVAIAALIFPVPPSQPTHQEVHRMSSHLIPASPHADADIRALIAQQAAAWNRHDARAWASPFLPSAEFINILGTPFSGKPAIEGITTRIFATIFRESHDSVTVRKLVWVTPEIAIVHYEHAVSGYSALPPGIQASEPGPDGKGVLRTLMVYVVQRDASGKWMIVNGQNTAILPAFKGS